MRHLPHPAWIQRDVRVFIVSNAICAYYVALWDRSDAMAELAGRGERT